MTSKELAYLEDALSKENFIIEKMNIIISNIECEDCIKDVLDDAFSQLSPEEKAEALGYEIKRINGEW